MRLMNEKQKKELKVALSLRWLPFHMQKFIEYSTKFLRNFKSLFFISVISVFVIFFLASKLFLKEIL